MQCAVAALGYDPEEDEDPEDRVTPPVNGFVNIVFYCDYVSGKDHQYRLVLPYKSVRTSQQPTLKIYAEKPTLQYRDWNLTTGDWNTWETKAIFSHNMKTASRDEEGSYCDIIIEQVYHHNLLVRFADKDYELYTQDEDGSEALLKGHIGIEINGAATAFNISELGWYATHYDQDTEQQEPVWAQPLQYQDIHEAFTHSFYEQNGTGHDYSAYYVTDYIPCPTDNVAVQEQVHNYGDTIALGKHTTRPKIIFTTTTNQAYARPMVFNVGQLNPVYISEVDDTPYTTIYPDNFTWSRNNKWRGTTFSAEFMDFTEEEIIVPNSKAIVELYWDRQYTPGSERAEGALVAKKLFCYLDGSFKISDGEEYFGLWQPNLKATDGINGRLSQNHVVRDFPSLQGISVRNAFTWLLNSCGIKNDMITVDCTGADKTLPADITANLAGKNNKFLYSFDNGMGIVQAIDQIVGSLRASQETDVIWGVDGDGYFLFDKPEWETAADTDWNAIYNEEPLEDIENPDFDPLDPEDPEYDPDDIREQPTINVVNPDYYEITNITVDKSMSGYRNMIYLKMDGKTGLYTNTPSIIDIDDLSFVGEDRWHYLETNETMTSAEMMTLALKLYKEKFHESLQVEITTTKLDLEPDNFVQIWTTGILEFYNGSVFRILSESGTIDENCNALVTYTCGIEYYAASDLPEPEGEQ